MISELYYQYFYLFVVTLMTFFSMSSYNRWGKLNNENKVSTFWAFLLLTFEIIFVGTRPISTVFGDMGGYQVNYDILYGEQFEFNYKTENIIWDNFFTWMASIRVSFETWLFLVAIAYFGLMFLACRKIFGKNVLLALVVYLGAFSTYSYGVNGMKAGVAASLFLVAMAYRDKLWISIPVALTTYGFHHSMVVVIVAYFVALLVKKPKYYIIAWIVCVIIAALHITYFQTLFAGFSDEHGAGYLLGKRGTGFRIDFILYSAVPIFIGNYILNKYKYHSTTYSFFLRLYILTNSIWMLCMYAYFSNRIAYLSWFMYPIVLLYPFIIRDKDQDQGKYLRWVVYGHLCFTLFMTIIYYA